MACGGEDEPSGPPTPTSITLVSGGTQTGQAGLVLPQPVIVRVNAGSQPVSGVRVTFAVTTAGGSFSPSQVTTDANGTATSNWTLGGTVGDHGGSATVGTLTPVAFTATAIAGPPAILLAVVGNTQFGVVKRPVNTKPKVQLADAFGNPIPGRSIRFEVTAGGGSLTGDQKVTDASGHAELGSWTLGPRAGINRVLASMDANISTEVIAIGTAASLAVQAGNSQTVNAGTATPVAPAVLALDGDGQPLADIDVTFTVESGGGRVTGASQRTNAQGLASVGAWILGQTAGANSLLAGSAGVNPARFTAQGVPATAAILTATSPPNAEGIVSNFMASTPSVRVTDGNGNAVAGTQVTFEVVSGGGTVASPALESFDLAALAGAVVFTDFNGDATLGAWRLGPQPGTQSVSATVTGLPVLTFTANAAPVPAAEFDIELRFVGTQPTEAQRAAFEQAAARWMEVVLGDVSDELAQFPPAPNGCYPALDEVIDDLIIYAELVPIDGAGGVLGSAGPCLIRDNGQTGVGRMRFDTADLTALEAAGQLDEVVLHEMGHVLGIGTLWSLLELITGAGSSDPYFTGPAARAAWRVSAVNLGYGGNIVPVENTGGSGTRDGHWRESLARNELMTGFLNNGSNPLSVFTIGSLRDMAYVVNDAVADELLLLPQIQAAAAAPSALELREVPLADDIHVIRRGRIIRSIPRTRF